jgi:hydroxylaminobenzene mutase
MESGMLHGASFILCFSGLALFFLGLLNGFAIPSLKSPRLGLTAHLTGVQSGTFLIAVGLMWDHIPIWRFWSIPLASGVASSTVAVWFALLLAAAFGAGQGLPIAGQGVTTTARRQRAVTILVGIGSLGLTLTVAVVLISMALAQ